MIIPHNLGYTFRRLAEADSLRNDSFILVRQNGEDVKIELRDLYKDLFKQYIEEMHISSMAYQDKEEYAKLKHDHDCYSHTVFNMVEDFDDPYRQFTQHRLIMEKLRFMYHRLQTGQLNMKHVLKQNMKRQLEH